MADDLLLEARDLMRRALELVDQDGSALDVGAHLDLALVRLSEMLADGRHASENDNCVIVEADHSTTASSE
jgi:hypothetical protein